METIKDLIARNGWANNSVKSLPILEQVAEIDRRCSIVLDWGQEQEIPLTKAHMRLALGVGESAFAAWASGDTGHRGMRYEDSAGSEEEKQGYRGRAEALKKWEDMFFTWTVQIGSTKRNSAMEIFLSKSVYGYREQEPQGAQVQLSLSIEGLLADVQAARLRQIEPQTIDVTPTQQTPSD